MVLGSQRVPMPGAAAISSPHQYASTGRSLRNPPYVRNTVVADIELTLTPVGFTRTCAPSVVAATARTANTNRRVLIRKVAG